MRLPEFISAVIKIAKNPMDRTQLSTHILNVSTKIQSIKADFYQFIIKYMLIDLH